ncbi:hypothetical protein SARC_09614 [Sphaeroforma arctica JP610]|uniref:Uncharacterized protein n=1 Tax=Sphaeroforma arctica JP610 TaxID=667725 RepID=A0A0L0FMF6_9EUKA|nr:hypothetical protein SARC_09614 [Sphaeroforma arctica JP610]KNC77940.1 hypothetical protein SARC_09614 [Sphaeroforma arctica JP610]|eukprot:XP_014151842.1 hypothetical protein SARC_09614 [Sphaeroforma arctica JP610]
MWRCVISLTGCGLVVNAQCAVVISLLQNVDYGGQIPSGLEDAPAIIATGAREGFTLGGPATAESKCVYYYEPDSDALGADPKYDGKAQFIGPDWPYVEADSNCTIEIDESIPRASVFRNPGYVTISTYDGLLFGGLPLYFYPDDAPGKLLRVYAKFSSKQF